LLFIASERRIRTVCHQSLIKMAFILMIIFFFRGLAVGI
jgi:hypothetical protein